MGIERLSLGDHGLLAVYFREQSCEVLLVIILHSNVVFKGNSLTEDAYIWVFI